jgi:serine/threonine-protein kinase
MIELRVLGATALTDPADGHELESVLAQPKRLALLAYLAIARPRGFHRRDSVLGLFWPEATEERARHALSQALYVLNRGMGPGVIQTRGDHEIGVDRNALWCDVVAFEEALNAGERAKAMELYQGELLSGFYVGEAREFERWLDGERSRLAAKAVDAAWELAEESERTGNGVEAGRWASKATSLAPYDEAGVRRIMELLARLCDSSGVLQEYEAFVKRLERDLGTVPAAETTALADRVRSGDALPREPAVTPEPAESQVSHAPDAGRAVARQSVAGGESTEDPPLAGDRWASSPRTPVRWFRPWTLIPVAGVLAAVVGLRVMGRSETGTGWEADPTRRVMVTVFENETGDADLDVLGRMAADWITQGLGETGLMEVVMPRTADEILVGLEAGAGTLSLGGEYRPLPEDEQVSTIVRGAYYRFGDSLTFQAHILDGRDASVLASLEPISTVEGAAHLAVVTLRERLAATLASLVDARLARWTQYGSKPPTLEAYAEFSKGLDAYLGSFDTRTAVERLLNAARADSSFTLPLLWVLWFPPTQETADSILAALESRRSSLPPLDRSLLDYHTASSAPAAYRAAFRVAELSPGSFFMYKAAKAALRGMNRPLEAIQFLQRADPDRGALRDWGLYWRVFVEAYHAAGDHERELATIQERIPDGLFPEVFALGAAGRIDDIEALLEPAPALINRTLTLGTAILLAAEELRAHGYSQHAAAMAARGFRWYDSVMPPRLNDYLIVTREWAYAGQLDRAGRLIDQMEEEFAERGVEAHWGVLGMRGVLAAMHGDRETALAYSERLEGLDHRPHLDWLLSTGKVRSWQARIALHLGERDRAMSLLREALLKGHNDASHLHMDPLLAPLWDDAEFRELMRPKG